MERLKDSDVTNIIKQINERSDHSKGNALLKNDKNWKL